MKIIVNKSELEALQLVFDTVSSAITEIDPSADDVQINLFDRLSALKDQAHVKYKLFSGDFEITISSEPIIAFLQLVERLTIKSLPLLKLLEPVVQMMPELMSTYKSECETFTDKYILPKNETDDDRQMCPF